MAGTVGWHGEQLASCAERAFDGRPVALPLCKRISQWVRCVALAGMAAALGGAAASPELCSSFYMPTNRPFAERGTVGVSSALQPLTLPFAVVLAGILSAHAAALSSGAPQG